MEPENSHHVSSAIIHTTDVCASLTAPLWLQYLVQGQHTALTAFGLIFALGRCFLLVLQIREKLNKKSEKE